MAETMTVRELVEMAIDDGGLTETKDIRKYVMGHPFFAGKESTLTTQISQIRKERGLSAGQRGRPAGTTQTIEARLRQVDSEEEERKQIKKIRVATSEKSDLETVVDLIRVAGSVERAKELLALAEQIKKF